MSYDVQCRDCKKTTWAANIVDLLKDHTNQKGRFLCDQCRGTNTFIYRKSKLQEEGDVWHRWIKGVICIETGVTTYSPYIFLTADAEDGPITGLHFNYYKDTRPHKNGRLKHGHGPGGAPVLGNKDLFVIIEQLVSLGILSKDEVKTFANGL